MDDAGLIGLALVATFLANAAPAFAPANWMVLAAFRLLGAPVLPLGLAGAAGATAGRAALAGFARSAGGRLGGRRLANAESLANRIDGLGRGQVPFFAAYAVSPLPSNVLFIALGAGRLGVRRACAVFFACRAVTDTFWMWFFATSAESALRGLFADWLDWRSLLAQAGSLVAVVALFWLPWARWLGTATEKRPRGPGG